MLSLAAVVPHGDEILVPEDEESRKLHRAMKFLGYEIKKRRVREYVFISPHNIRIDTHIGIILTEYLEGKWRYKNLKFRRKYKVDRELAFRIYDASQDIPRVGINFGALEGDLSSMCLDWGTLIPLYFLPKRKMVLITPARGIKRNQLVKFGEVLGEIIENEKRKIALIVSADHAHAHSKNGPYGYHPDAEKYDRSIERILLSNSLKDLNKMSKRLIENAKPDSYWQLLILYGVLKKVPMENFFTVYGRPSYFGMAVSIFERK